jgi:hypothetical protein
MNNEFEKYLSSKKFLEYGYVHQTPAFHLTHYQFVFHVRSPDINKSHLDSNTGINEVIFYNLLRKSFIELDLKSLATPLIGTGFNKIDVIDCISDFVEAIFKFLNDSTNKTTSSTKSHLFAKAQSVHQFPNNATLNESTRRCVYIVNKDLDVLNLCKNVIDNKINLLNKSNTLPKVKIEQTSNISTKSSKSTSDENCVICMDSMSLPKQLDKCGHKFCTQCIEDYFKTVKQTCPICNTVYKIR